jgi:branched-chain amino acid transport system substrate-binding protein
MIVAKQPALRFLSRALQAAICLAAAAALLLPASCDFPGAVRPTVKIGLVAPFEGRYRAVGYDVIYAARLALREVNQAGGVAGYAVELVAYDDGAQTAMALEQARKLSVDPDLLAAVGHFRDETTRAAVGVYAQAGLPLVAPAVLDLQLTPESEALYRLGPPASLLADALLERATELITTGPESSSGGGTVVLVGQGGPLGTSLEDLDRIREAGHSEIRLTSVSADAADWREDVLAHDPDVIICDLEPVRAGEVVAALRGLGWLGPVLGGPALAASDFVAVAGESARGAIFVTPWPFPPDVPGGDAFVSAYRDLSGGVEPGPFALPAYEATCLVLDALGQAAAAGGPTRDRVAEALSDVEREGLLGHVALREDYLWLGEALYWYRIGSEGVPSLADGAPPGGVASSVEPAHLQEGR